MNVARIRILVTGGGTGGHLFPAVAVIQEVRRIAAHCEVIFAGTSRSVDTDNLQRYGITARSITCRGLKNMGVIDTLVSLLLLPLAFVQALALVVRFRPHVAFGVGGYVTGPVLLAARLAGVPVAIHEQNVIPGIANRLAARLARTVFLSWPESGSFFTTTRTQVTGNPVRSEIAAARKGPADLPVLAVLGGSQGARGVNRMVFEAIASAVRRKILPEDFSIIHQTGPMDADKAESVYKKLGVTARTATFFHDMRAVYDQASCVVSRAGATTLAELCLLGKPALLVPYPFAADNHQEKNARMLEKKGAARVFLETADPDELADSIAGILQDSDKQKAMAKAMRYFARPEAATRIAEHLLQIVAGEY